MERNLRTGVSWGLSFAAVYGLYVVALWLVRGPSPFAQAGTTLVKVLAAYFAAGLLSGAVVGLLLPIARQWFGAAVVGLVAALPAFFAIGMAAEPPSAWLTTMPGNAIVAALVLGPAAGVSMWFQGRWFANRNR